jgi:hypothetical protein
MLVNEPVTQLPQQPRQVYFRVSGLKAALERGLDALLGLGVAHAFGKEVRVAAEVLYRCERNGIDPVLDRRGRRLETRQYDERAT